MGRTPVFFNTDMNLMHDFPLFKGHENMKLRFEFSVFNLFNTKTVTNEYTLYNHQLVNGGIIQPIGGLTGIFSNGVDVNALMAAQGIPVDPEYGQANAWQSPRMARLQLKFFF